VIQLGSQQITNWSQPYLSGCGTFYVHPGGDPQDLHRDDFVYSHRNGEAKEYVVGRDMMINMLVACTESVKANGATRLIPGSHLWDYSVPCSEDDVVWADLQPGDALMILGSVFHAGSRNTTDRVRHVLSTTAVRGEFRGEENGYLTYSKEQILRLPVHLQKFFGYTFFPPSLNYVDFKDFLHRIDPDPPAKEFAHWIGQLTGVEESD
jgi:ectoine hydroxylase-related dioxygenase (phytanoyl-CoA dioxygenase family)